MDESGASIDEDARRRFEADWRAGNPDPIEAYLPPAADPRRRATLEELVCIDLECARKRRQPPVPIEDYLRRFPELGDPAVVGRLVREEWLVRHRFGETPDRGEYRSRFPTLFAGADLDTALPWSPEPGDTHAESAADLTEPGGFPTIQGHDVLRLLKAGGMGAVYLARQQRLGRLVALKVIRGGAATAEELGRFRAEAEAVARLRHPNVVQVFETGEWEPAPGAPGQPYFTMEYVPGGSLADRLGGQPRPAADAARLVETLARAVDSAHRAGIVHRDLKPGNVLLDGAPAGGPQTDDDDTGDWKLGTPKVTDFGLAKRLGDDAGHTRTGDLVGTPSYMSPEQAAGKNRQVGPATDIWALGAILYELITGRPPFRGESGWDTLQQVLTADPVPPRRLVPRLPRDVETIAFKCLEKDPVRRYATAAELAADLGRFRSGEPIRARPIGPVGRAGKWARRRPAAAALVAVAALLPVSLAAAGLWYADAQKRRAEESERERLETARQRDRAQENFALGFEVISRMVVHARDARLLGLPEAEETSRRLLEEAVEFCERLLQQQSNDPQVRRFTALAHRLVGDVRTHTGRYDEAAAAYGTAIDLHERLMADVPGEPLYAQDLSGTLLNRAELWYHRDRLAEAAADLGRAIAVRRQLADDYPDRPVYRRELAAALDNLGAHESERGHYPEADRLFAAALDTLVRLRAERPDDPDVAAVFAACSANAGLARWHQRQLARAEVHLRDAIAVHRQLAARSAEPKHQAALGGALNLLGLVLGGAGRATDAEAALTEAAHLQQRLAADHPAVPAYHSDLGGTLNNLADRLLDRGDAARARRLLDEAVRHQHAAVMASPANPKYREFLANHYALLGDTALSLGDHAAAATAATGLAATGPGAQDALDAAGQTAACIPLVRKDPSLTAEQKEAKAAEYTDKAIHLLREAARRGHRDPEGVRTNPAFAPLRDRADFRKVLAEMTAGR